MAGVVLDASALIAMLKNEPGAAEVAGIIDKAALGIVNYSEVVTHYVRNGSDLRDIEAMLRPLPVRIVDVDPAFGDRGGGAGGHHPLSWPVSWGPLLPCAGATGKPPCLDR